MQEYHQAPMAPPITLHGNIAIFYNVQGSPTPQKGSTALALLLDTSTVLQLLMTRDILKTARP